MTNPYLGFRLSEADLAAIDTLAGKRGCSRSEAARLALMIGLPLASSGIVLNMERVALLLEYTQACVDLIVTREHADYADRIEAIARQRVADFHA